MPYAFARGPQGPAGEGGMTGIPGAAADGVTDDTQALTDALARSNTVIDGGCLRYKYGVIDMTGVENAEIRNVIFNRGTQLNLWGCRNITFRNCRWEGVFNNGENRACYGVALRKDAAGDGSKPGCENIAFYGCTFRDIAYNDLFTGLGYAHHTTGQAILPMSVHNLTVKDCFFTQIKGNAAIHFNSTGKLGFVDISDNLFYLTCFGGICLYAYVAYYPTVKGRVCGNRFIGCGLGYLPDEYVEFITEKYRGVGCAALLGGAGPKNAPYKQHFACENNVFIDCCESSIEGPCWNPCIGNSCYGQGTLQDEANCRLMEQKYHLDYTLHVRYNPSINFIYRNVYSNADGGDAYPDKEPIFFHGNVMSKSYVDRDGFIMITGGNYTTPVIFTENVLEVEKSGKLHTHFLNCNFQSGVTLRGNRGIRPYFNGCKVAGDLEIDDMLNAWNTDFSACNLKTIGDRFPEARMTNYDPTVSLLQNDQAKLDGGIITLTAHDAPVVVPAPTDYVYTIESNSAYVAGEGVTFEGAINPTRIDTGVKLLENGGDFTIFLRFFGDDKAIADSGIYPLFMTYEARSSSGHMAFGGKYNNVYTTFQLNSSVTVNLDESKRYPRHANGMKAVVRRKGSQIQCWLCYANDDAQSITEHLVTTTDVPESNFDGAADTLLIGARDGYWGSNDRALSGRMEAFQVFARAISDAEASMLLYGKNVAPVAEADPSENVVYDIATDEHYDAEAGCVTFDGTFAIDTGVELFADSSDFTVAVQFRLSDYTDAGLRNFSFIPVISAMNYTEDYRNSPGIDLGLSLQLGDNPETIARGGFVMLRNSWKFSNAKYFDSSRYFAYYGQTYGAILIRENGVLSVYDYNMQRKATLTGADVTSLFSGTLRIGGNMVAPTLGEDYMLRGKVYECKVYNRALTSREIEVLYPNIVSNEFRTKGTARFLVPNRRYVTQNVSYMVLDLVVDMGEYGTPEYAGRYPHAVGVKVNGIDDMIWIGTGSNGHVQRTIKHMTTVKPYRNYQVDVANSGLVPGMSVKVRGFRCVLIGKEVPYVDTVDALDFDVEWESEPLELSVGGTLSGFVRYEPEDATAGTELTMTIEVVEGEGSVLSAAQENGVITLTGESAGTALVTVSIPCGMVRSYQVTVTGAE